MIKVIIKNIQAIENATIELKDNTIVEFIGDNSNGKSILSKIITTITNGDYKDKDIRNTLIRDGAQYGAVYFIHDLECLAFIFRSERSESFVEYTENINDKESVIRRHFDEGGIEQLVFKFGFRTYQKGDICLQISPTFGAVPFITTSGSTNFDIVNDITIDKVAEDIIENYSQITYKLFKERYVKCIQEEAFYKTMYESVESYDVDLYTNLSNEINSCIEGIGNYKYHSIGNIPVPPKTDVVPVNDFSIKSIPIVTVVQPLSSLQTLSKELEDLSNIERGVCPTCGKPLVEQ